MPARWTAGVALVAISTTSRLWVPAAAPQAVITRCAAQAGPIPAGISALNKACPGLENALTQLQLTTLLPSGWRQSLTARGLSDVDKLLQRYSESPPSEAPKAADLRSIAAGLAPQQAAPTWLGRIRAWIRRSLLQPLDRWLRSLGPSLRSVRHPQAILYGLAALLLTAIAAALAFELRGTGLTRPLRTALLPRRRRVTSGPTESVQSHFPEPDWTRLREQPARVLRLLVDTLTRARRLERDRHLTCRELEMQARFETEIERTGFAQVARLAERELYGPPGVTVLPDEVLRDAQTLHARLLVAGEEAGT
jgi:hypothetical protein